MTVTGTKIDSLHESGKHGHGLLRLESFILNPVLTRQEKYFIEINSYLACDRQLCLSPHKC
jgi:hypothetical protein